MHAFDGGILSEQMSIELTSSSPVNIGNADSRLVATFYPVPKISDSKDKNTSYSSAEKAAFRKSFYATLENQVEGAISPHLFFDPPGLSEDAKINYSSAWGAKENIPYGAPSWDIHISESTSENESHVKLNQYGFAEGDAEVIHYAIQNGLIDRLPRRMTYYSYGPGEMIAVHKKDFQLVDAIMSTETHSVEGLNGVDINYRYARNFADHANEKYNRVTAAILGDFMEGTVNPGNKIGTSVIGIFGGPFANAPNIKNVFNAKQKAAQYLAQLVSQHGEGTRVINTIDTQSDPEILKADYNPTKQFEAFILGAFPRAVNEGIIVNPKYDVFKHWKLTQEFDEAQRTVKLMATAKKSHDLNTDSGKTYAIEKGQNLTFTLSHKWGQQEWKDIYQAAGFDDVTFYGEGSRKLILARATGEPNLSLIA